MTIRCLSSLHLLRHHHCEISIFFATLWTSFLVVCERIVSFRQSYACNASIGIFVFVVRKKNFPDTPEAAITFKIYKHILCKTPCSLHYQLQRTTSKRSFTMFHVLQQQLLFFLSLSFSLVFVVLFIFAHFKLIFTSGASFVLHDRQQQCPYPALEFRKTSKS